MNPVLVEVLRGAELESNHRGAIAVLDADGAVLASLGEIDRPIFPRSAVKLLQALPLVDSGAAERLGLTDPELALACASHNGEEAHVQTAAGMLAKVGLDAAALECGAHWPSLDTATRALAAAGRQPCALHNNCSGKHSGFLCLASALPRQGVDLRQFVKGYVNPDHPVMREVTDALQAVTGFDAKSAPRGTDGCSIPTYGIALRQLALGFARVGTGVGLREGHARAALRLRRAIANAPFMVAGSGRFDTRVMQQFGERVCCKVGAEGVFCAALPDHGLGVAIKIDDGNARAAEVALASTFESCLRLSDLDAQALRALSHPRLRNWNGIDVGQLRPAPSLTRLRLQ